MVHIIIIGLLLLFIKNILDKEIKKTDLLQKQKFNKIMEKKKFVELKDSLGKIYLINIDSIICIEYFKESFISINIHCNHYHVTVPKEINKEVIENLLADLKS